MWKDSCKRPVVSDVKDNYFLELPLSLPFRKPLKGFEQKEQLEILEYFM